MFHPPPSTQMHFNVDKVSSAGPMLGSGGNVGQQFRTRLKKILNMEMQEQVCGRAERCERVKARAENVRNMCIERQEQNEKNCERE